jgi:hypothetical protein
MVVLILISSLCGAAFPVKPFGLEKACENRDERIAYLRSLFCLLGPEYVLSGWSFKSINLSSHLPCLSMS